MEHLLFLVKKTSNDTQICTYNIYSQLQSVQLHINSQWYDITLTTVCVVHMNDRYTQSSWCLFLVSVDEVLMDIDYPLSISCSQPYRYRVSSHRSYRWPLINVVEAQQVESIP